MIITGIERAALQSFCSSTSHKNTEIKVVQVVREQVLSNCKEYTINMGCVKNTQQRQVKIFHVATGNQLA